MNSIVITPTNKLHYEYLFKYRCDKLMNYINNLDDRCALCNEVLCKGHTVGIKLEVYFVYYNFLTEFIRYLNSNYILTVSGASNVAVFTKPKSENWKYLEKDLSLNYNGVKVDWQEILKSIMNGPDKNKASRYITNIITLTPQKMRTNRFAKKHYEITVLNTIVNNLPKPQLKDIYKLAMNNVDSQPVIQTMPTKTGAIRKYVFCKYTVNNGRAVIVPSLEDYGYICLPQKFRNLVTEDYYNVKRFKNFGYNIKYYELDNKWYNYTGDNDLTNGTKVLRNIVDGDYVIANRQPTLHWRSMMTHKVKFWDNETIGLHRCCTHAYNADFDGDEMNIHAPPSLRTHLEFIFLLNSKLSILDSNKCYIGPLFHELAILYKISQDPNFKDRLIFPKTFIYDDNGVTIQNGTLISGILTKKNVGMHLGSVFHSLQYYGEVEMARWLTNMCKVCDEYMNSHNFTLTNDFLNTMIDSGCRGDRSNLAQINEKIGPLVFGNKQLKLDDTFDFIPSHESYFHSEVEGNYRNGLTAEEVIHTSIPIRESIVKSKLNIAESGTIMNRLYILMSNYKIYNHKLIYNDNSLAENISISYKYFDHDYNTYINIRQLVYDCVVYHRIIDLMQPIKKQFEVVRIKYPTPTENKEPLIKFPPKISMNEEEFNKSFEYTHQTTTLNTQININDDDILDYHDDSE